MDNDPTQSKRRRFSILHLPANNQQPNSPGSVLARGRKLYNELVYEACRAIPTVKTCDSILLTAENIRTYLEPKFRRKNSIYRNAICFLKTSLADSKFKKEISKFKKEITITVDQLGQSSEREQIVIHQRQSAHEFELKTDQLRIRLVAHYNPYSENVFCFCDAEPWNRHMLYFVRLIAPLIKPASLDAYMSSSTTDTSKVALFLDTICCPVERVHLRAEQLLSAHMCAALAKHDKLQITYYETLSDNDRLQFRHACLSDGDRARFRLAFRQWLNAGNFGHENKCNFTTTRMVDQELNALLDEIKTDFSCATTNCPFAVRFALVRPPGVQPSVDKFTLHNDDIGELLELTGPTQFGSDMTEYVLVRRPIGNLSGGDKCQELVAEFQGMTSIALK